MKIHILSVGNRMPAWIQTGVDEYTRRMPPECRVSFVELAPGQRSKNADLARILRQESERMLAAIPKGAKVVALDVKGREWSTEQLAGQLSHWMEDGRDVALLIGGPDGIDATCMAVAEQRWSLSPLTFPHPLVRVIVAEQLYRANSVLNNHPYHRA